MNAQVIETTLATLCEAYEKQAAGYAQALSLAENLAVNWKPGADVVVALQPIVAIMDEIATRTAAIEGLRQQWLQSCQPPGPRLEAVLQSMAKLIERLAVRIRELEQLASDYKNQLVPQLDRLQRARQMQRAYAGAAFRREPMNG